MYYISEDGDVYSKYSNKLLKHYIDHDGHHRVDIHGKHIKVHKLVYLTWVGELKQGEQINHKDDNKDNNHYANLYAGSQKENIRDCVCNEHRGGNVWHLVVYDKIEKKVLTFCPASDFIEYSGHSCQNKSVNRMFSRNWFKERYILVDYNKKGVTTIADECRLVG